MTFNVQTGLRNWAHMPSSPFAVNLNATQVSVGALTQAAKVSTPITGTLNANIVAHGTPLNPIGQGEINLRNANISGEPVKSAQVKFQGTGDAVHANLLVQVSAGNATGQLTYYPRQEGYDALIQATNIQLAKIETLRAAKHGCERHAEPDGERQRNAEQSAGHGFAHHPAAERAEAAD